MTTRDGGTNDRWQRGWETLTRVNGTDAPGVVHRVEELAPEFARHIVEYAYGDVYARPTLAPAQRQLVTIGTLAGMGGCEAQLRVHVNVALEVGLTPDEIAEAVMHVAPFAGFPRALNALEQARSVFEKRGVWTSDAWREPAAT